MKRVILLTYILYSTTFLYSQIVLESSEMLPFGSKFSLALSEDPSLIDTTAGESVVWDMSDLTTNIYEDEYILEIVNPKNTPYAEYFPNSNYAFKENDGLAYRYFNLSNLSLKRVGSYVYGPKVYQNAQVEYVFPLEYGVKNEDTWNNSVVIMVKSIQRIQKEE